MSTSLLYHAFGLTDLDYIKTEYIGGTVIFYVRTKEDKFRCSNCQSCHVIKKGFVEMTFRTVPIGSKLVYLKARLQRLKYKECGVIRQEYIWLADEKKAIPTG